MSVDKNSITMTRASIIKMLQYVRAKILEMSGRVESLSNKQKEELNGMFRI
jgi:hypothetical protein